MLRGIHAAEKQRAIAGVNVSAQIAERITDTQREGDCL